MKHVKEFNKFLASEVNLDQGQRTRLNQRLRAVNEFLSQALDSYVKHERQGSYALDTIIRPVFGTEYDTDILVFLKYRRGRKARSYMDEMHEALGGHKNYADKLQRKTRAITRGLCWRFPSGCGSVHSQGNPLSDMQLRREQARGVRCPT